MTFPTDANCVFCKIVVGQLPCFKLLEDDATVAFMDINPVNPGHALAVAKGHWPTVHVIPADVLAAVARTAQRIAKASGGQAGTGQELLAGMILSNEPGYYKAGDFGIRIENLVLVEPREIAGAEGDYFGFETLTFAPIDKALVDLALMTPDEIDWWNTYHAQVEAILAPQLDGAALDWLKAACAPLSGD